MRSFEIGKRTRVKDTTVPSEKIPVIIMHWYDRFYYGSNESLTQIRAYLEPKFRENPQTKEAVQAWIKNAENWAKMYPRKERELRAEYFQITVVVAK